MSDTDTIRVRASAPRPIRITRRAPGRDRGPDLVTRARVEHIMGMPISIHLRGYADDVESALPAVDQAYAHLRQVDRVFSTYRPDSDLMRLRAGRSAAGAVHPWLRDVVDLCLQAEERTDGLFTAWLPSPTDDPTPVFDPTGLVKGWGVEGAAEYLGAQDAIAFALNAGGDLALGLGRGAHGLTPPWRVGVEDPRDPTAIGAVIHRVSGGVATSGARARGAHVVDPRTGQGIAREGSATVDGPSLLWADIWATAAFVDPGLVARLLPARDPDYRLTVL